MPKSNWLFLFFFLLILTSCTIVKPGTYCMPLTKNNKNSIAAYSQLNRKNYTEQGVASWYGRRFNKKRTSSGERYNMYGMTAAHKTLPLSTYVRVTNLNNDKKVIVRVNDRGPFAKNSVIDLSYAAAKKLHMVGAGTANVKIEAISRCTRS